MRKIIFVLVIIILMITPIFTYAVDCNNQGVTAIYVNGIFNSESSAKADKNSLEDNFKKIAKRNDVTFINGFNPSHLSGLGDLIKSVEQAYQGASIDYDLVNILTQVHSELSTRKVLLVGHSQGTFYTNEAYKYLIAHGVPKDSIAVYNVATPADKVEGNGDYLTSNSDKVINSIVRDLTGRGFAKKPLPANINIKLTPEEEKDPFGGHSLSGVYLKEVPDRIVGDMQKEINNLSEGGNTVSSGDGCFTAPKITLSHLIMGMSFNGLDNISASTVNLTTELAKISSQKISDALAYIYNFSKTFNISSLFIASLTSGTSLDKSTSQDVPQSPDSQNSEIAQVSEQDPIVINSNDKQDQIDDILEKIDILKRQIEELNKNSEINNKDNKIELTDAQTQPQDNLPNNPPINPPTTKTGGGGSKTVYSKILISEIQVAGLTDQKEEFVELYNPNAAEIDLTNWYLQKKTKTGSDYSTFVSNTLFLGKKIGINDYFLVARENSSFAGSADIITDNSLAEDNSLILKNPNGEISDKLGFGQAQEYGNSSAQNPEKGQSIGRKWDTANNIEQDTDNNLTDFEAQNSTPKAKNITFVAPPNIPPQTPTDKTAPEVTFSLDAIQTNLTFAINFTLVDPITTVSPSGIDSYIFRWQKESDGWQEDSSVKVDGNPASATLIKDFTGQDETTYYFQIKTKDVAGNESDWQPETPTTTKISIQKKILINEVQIDSIVETAGTDDDWVELYNPNNVAVSLSGWSIQKHSKSDPCSISTGFYKKNFSNDAVIPIKGFFLIVDTEAQESLKVIADMTIGWSLSDNNTIYLVRNQNKINDGSDPDIVDKVGFGEKACFPETNPAFNPPEAKSIERKKLGQDTDDNSADFRISDDPTPKAGSPKVYIQDATDYSNSMSGSGSIYYYNLKIKWGSNNPNVDFYNVQYKMNNGNWQDWVLQTKDTEKIYLAYDSMFTDYVYQFRVRAQDKEGNLGDWAEITVDVTNPIVINEVALFGTNASTNDQWIELYNRSDKDIDLTGWKIGLHEGFSQTLQGIILAKGYLVLNASDGGLTGSVDGFSVSLANQKNRQIDKFYVPIGLGRWGWLDSDFKKDGNYYSMERISPYSFGSNIMNWRINNGIIINGKDKDGNPIYGTPGQQNSNYQIYTSLSEDFAEDTTLSLSLSPYLIAWNQLSVYKNKILTIDPGVIIKFYNSYGLAGLKIDGILNVIGTPDQKIIFTSFFDDEYGGDIDGYDTPVNPSAGNWVGLQFTKDANNLSKLDNIILRYAGYNIADLGGSGIRVDQVSISLKNSTIEKNLQSGVSLLNSSSVIDAVNFLDNEVVPGYDPRDGEGVFIQGGNPQIMNSYFKRNVYGIKMQSWWNSENKEFPPLPTFENNTFENNTFDIFDANNPPPPSPAS
ncbi:MAG: lamin tail domain-containing protein [Candidatus Staskawiczbacteria bacterium]|nr:lamin tail domain-containing protein [Candidatus Staskawiczbacteria bacterium]